MFVLVTQLLNFECANLNYRRSSGQLIQVHNSALCIQIFLMIESSKTSRLVFNHEKFKFLKFATKISFYFSNIILRSIRIYKKFSQEKSTKLSFNSSKKKFFKRTTVPKIQFYLKTLNTFFSATFLAEIYMIGRSY